MADLNIKLVAENTKVSDYLNYRDYLLRIYMQLKDERDSYSYTEFSSDLGFAKTNVSWLYVTGRRNLTSATKARVIKALGLRNVNRRYFELLVDYNKARLPEKREEIFRKLIDLKNEMTESGEARKNLEYFSEWYHPVIRELIAMSDFQNDISWIAKRLQNRVLPNEIKKSLQLLVDLGVIDYDGEKQTYVQVGRSIYPDRDVEVMAAVRFHQKMIEIAKEAVTKTSENRREINAMTLSLSREGFEEIRKAILELCKKSMTVEENDKNKSDVYQLNVQLFPFTKE